MIFPRPSDRSGRSDRSVGYREGRYPQNAYLRVLSAPTVGLADGTTFRRGRVVYWVPSSGLRTRSRRRAGRENLRRPFALGLRPTHKDLDTPLAICSPIGVPAPDPHLDNPEIPTGLDSTGQPVLESVAGTELTLPVPGLNGTSFIKKRIASYLHLELKAADIQALLGLNDLAYRALIEDPEVLVERRKIAAEELHRAAFLRLQLAQAAGPSLDKLVKLRDTAKDERTQLAAAESLLDREGTLTRKITATPGPGLLVVTDDQVKMGLRVALESLAPTLSIAPGAVANGGSPALGEGQD